MFNIRNITAALGAAVLMAAPLSAQSVEEFYEGKEVSLVIGYSPGGGYDTYARLVARHMGKHIPGNPTVVPQNMPGAGSLRATNWLYESAEQDGTVFLTMARAAPVRSAVRQRERRVQGRRVQTTSARPTTRFRSAWRSARPASPVSRT